jgi:hypothetical protein
MLKKFLQKITVPLIGITGSIAVGIGYTIEIAPYSPLKSPSMICHFYIASAKACYTCTKSKRVSFIFATVMCGVNFMGYRQGEVCGVCFLLARTINIVKKRRDKKRKEKSDN